MTQQKKISVMLADDHPLLRAGFAQVLQDIDYIEVIAEAGEPDEAISTYFEKQPDVLVLDIRFQTEKTGIDLLQEILEKEPTAKIILLSQHEQDELIKRGYKIGAKSYISKDSDPNELVIAIQKAMKNELHFPAGIAERLAHLSTTGSALDDLSDKEVEILKLIAMGKQNKEISDKLGITLKTVANRTTALKNKLGIDRTAGLVAFAIKNKVIFL